MQVLANMFVAKARTAQKCRRMNGAAGYDDGFAGDGNAMPTFRDGFDAGGVAGFNANFLSACFGDDAGVIFLCVGNPGFCHRLFGT